MNILISDFLGFLDYYREIPAGSLDYYKDPCTRVLYDAISKDGQDVLANMTPYAHAICCLCYREPDADAHYNQKNIAEICHVSKSVVSMWKDEKRMPEKYHWLLLLVDISENMGTVYGHEVLHTETLEEASSICDIYLRMIGSCFDPFCIDDCVLADAVMRGSGIDSVKDTLKGQNPDLWNEFFSKVQENGT